jgi:hypothetical protein
VYHAKDQSKNKSTMKHVVNPATLPSPPAHAHTSAARHMNTCHLHEQPEHWHRQPPFHASAVTTAASVRTASRPELLLYRIIPVWQIKGEGEGGKGAVV